MFSNVSGHNNGSQHLAFVIFIDRTIEEDIGEFAIFVTKGKWRIGHVSFGENNLIHLAGHLRFGEIVKEIGARQFFARNACDIGQGFIHIGDLAFGADGHQRVQTGFNQTAVSFFTGLDGPVFFRL